MNLSTLFCMCLALFATSYLTGCVYATYNAEKGSESLRVITLWKEVDGFYADRNGEEFVIQIDKTKSGKPFEELAALLEQVDKLRAMGISYDPPPAEIPFPVE